MTEELKLFTMRELELIRGCVAYKRLWALEDPVVRGYFNDSPYFIEELESILAKIGRAGDVR